jgi:hypothetical protein
MENLIKLTDKICDNLIKPLRKHPETGEQCEYDYGDAKYAIEMVVQSEIVGNLLYKFWQRTSDACPLECCEAEKQEKEFKEWTILLDWDALNAL